MKSSKTGKSGAPRTTRQLRVGEEIRHVLAAAFVRNEFRDPVLAAAQLTVAEVRTSTDMRHATVFVSRLGRSDINELLPALKRASPFLRGIIAKAMPQQRMVPELHFQPDAALEYASHVNALLKQPEVARDLEVK
jgi:ribosome-binding factor A